VEGEIAEEDMVTTGIADHPKDLKYSRIETERHGAIGAPVDCSQWEACGAASNKARGALEYAGIYARV
jgi:hypothetical protein